MAMTKKEVNEKNLESLARQIAYGGVNAYDQRVNHLYEMDQSVSKEDLKKRLQDRVAEIKKEKDSRKSDPEQVNRT